MAKPAKKNGGKFRRHVYQCHEIIGASTIFVQGVYCREDDTSPAKIAKINLGQSVGASAVHDVYADAVNCTTGAGYNHVHLSGLSGLSDLSGTSNVQPEQKKSYPNWASENKELIKNNQEAEAIFWLSGLTEYAPTELVIGGKQHLGSKSEKGSPCYWAKWKTDRNGVDYLTVNFSTFRHGGYKESFSGKNTVREMWENERPHSVDPQAQAERRHADMEARARARAKASAIANARKERKLHGKNEKLAGFMWELHTLPKTGKSAYLQAKGVQEIQEAAEAAQIVYARDYIILPIQDVDGTIHGIQRISIKSKLIYGKKKGFFAVIGSLPDSVNSPVIFKVCEGLATGLSIHQATGTTVIVAMDAGNFDPVASTLRAKYPRSKFQFYADNDQWKPKNGNPGMTEAHRAAFKFNGLVFAPDFTGLDVSAKPTDFNDLAALGGIDRVRNTPGTNSDPAFAFSGEQEKEIKHVYGALSNANIEKQNGTRMDNITIDDGVTIIRSGIGTGKTYQAFRAANEGSGNSIYISHLVALSEDAANKDNRDLYNEHSAKDLREFQHISVCLNSLPKLSKEGKICTYDTVIIDETEQQLRRLTTKIENKALVQDTLKHLIQNAQKVICMDAHISEITMNFLRACRPGERFNVILNEYQPGTGRDITLYESEGSLWNAAIEAIGKGKRAFFTLNSKREARKLYLKISKEYSEKRGLYISGDNGGDTQVKAFFANVNEEAAKYDYIVCTPSVSTGVSIDSINGKAAFDFVGGCFSHQVNTPADCLQALGRVRDTTELHIYISPVRMNHIRSRKDIAAKWGETHKWDAALMGIDADGDRAIQNPLYSAICADVGEAEGFAMTNFRFNLLRLCYLDGYKMRWKSDTEDYKKILKEAKDIESAEYLGRIASADEINAEEHAELEHKNRLTFAETASKTKFEIQDFYIANDAELPEFISIDGRGKLRKRIRTLEITTADIETLAEISKPGDEQKLVPDIRHYAAENAFYNQVLNAVGINRSLEHSGKRYKANDLAGLISWIEEHRTVLAGIVRLPDPERLATNIIRYVGTWLNAMGIKQMRIGKSGNCEYGIDAEVLAFMQYILQKRGTFSAITIKEKIPESVPDSFNADADTLDFAEYNAGLIELGAMATWGVCHE